MQDWLIAQLEQTYPALRAIVPDAAAALVARGRVLPVLDGLDEVSPVRRAGIITALNTSLDGDGGVILTSRRGEYRSAVADAGDVLTAAAVIAPLALSGREAAAFLRTHLPPDPDAGWDAVLNALEEGRAAHLTAVTASPLGLWLVRTVYIDDRRPPGPLTDGSYRDAAALRKHLLDELIPAVVRSRPPVPRRRRDAPDVPLRPAGRHRPEDLRRWLTTLAEQLRSPNAGPAARTGHGGNWPDTPFRPAARAWPSEHSSGWHPQRCRAAGVGLAGRAGVRALGRAGGRAVGRAAASGWWSGWWSG